jgi:AraC-like DNA-binding protein
MTTNDLSLQLARALDGCPDATIDLFDALLTAHPFVQNATRLARRFGMNRCTLEARFRRAGLPSPKQYAVSAAVIRAAVLLQNRHLSGADVARQLGASSPQSFRRMLKTYGLGTSKSLRAQGCGKTMFDAFTCRMITPHLETLRTTTLVGERGA